MSIRIIPQSISDQAPAMMDVQEVFSKAIALHREGNYAEAAALYRRLLQVLPDNVSILGNLGIVCRELGQLEDAYRYCVQAAEIAGDDANQQLNVGAVCESLGRMTEAREWYQRALDLHPNHPMALNNLGKLHHLLGEPDHALSFLQRALEAAPDYPVALNNLGVLLCDLGRVAEALPHFHQSDRLVPDNPQTLYNLAGALNCLGQEQQALASLERLLASVPDHSSARHLQAALSGRTTSTAPREYIVETFDKYAHRFDEHLRGVLGYTVPEGLADLVTKHYPQRTFDRGLDLGCGTGLSAEPFSDSVKELWGVDLSSAMLAKAREKGFYHSLEEGDLLSFLEQSSLQFELFICADVLIYLGNPTPLFTLCGRRATPAALLLCSIESHQDQESYRLSPSGRYTHSGQQLLALAEQAGFSLVDWQEYPIRREEGTWLPGHLYLFAYRHKPATTVVPG